MAESFAALENREAPWVVSAGALLGAAVGAIAARSGRGMRRGAGSGAAIGGGVRVAHELVIRRGNDVLVHSGTRIQLQMEAPVHMTAPVYGAF